MKTMILSTEWGEWVFFLPELAALEALYADRPGAGRNEK